MISIIVAVAENYAIGKNNDLLWHISGDMKRFKALTIGHTVIMGKRTWESLPKRPLPGRTNIVITDDPSDHFDGCIMAWSIENALNKCNPQDESFIIGGASVYREFLPFTDRLYLTKVNKPFDADVFFPQINFEEWVLKLKEDYPPDDENDFSYTYMIYDRKK